MDATFGCQGRGFMGDSTRNSKGKSPNSFSFFSRLIESGKRTTQESLNLQTLYQCEYTVYIARHVQVVFRSHIFCCIPYSDASNSSCPFPSPRGLVSSVVPFPRPSLLAYLLPKQGSQHFWRVLRDCRDHREWLSPRGEVGGLLSRRQAATTSW